MRFGNLRFERNGVLRIRRIFFRREKRKAAFARNYFSSGGRFVGGNRVQAMRRYLTAAGDFAGIVLLKINF